MNPERCILEALAPCHPRGLRENVLKHDVRNYGAELSLTDLRRHLGTLETKGQVVIIKDEDFTLIKITAEGLARIAE